MPKRTAFGLVLTLLPALLATGGCSDPNQTKQELQTLLGKQADMQSYAFTGSADLELGSIPPAQDANSISASLVSMLLNGKLDWSGQTTVSPMRLEAMLRLAPAAAPAPAPLELPMLIKDNKMYFSLPLVNKKDEYLVVDMNGSPDGKSLLPADALAGMSGLTTGMASALLEDLPGKWVKKSNAGSVLPDGKPGTVYSIDITDRNVKDVSAAVQKKWPELIGSLQSKSLLTNEQAAKLKLKQLTVQAPGRIAFTADSQGAVRDESMKLDYTESDPAGTKANRHLQLHQTYDLVNQPITFTKEVPKNVKPFEDILKFIGNPKK